VIVGVVTCFKKKMVSTLVEFNIVTSTMKTSHVALPGPLPSILVVETSSIFRTFAHDVFQGVRQLGFEDTFANLIFGRAFYAFPTLIKKEKQSMKAILSGRSSFRENGLNMVKHL